MSEYHIPVLLEKSVSALISDPDGIYADATFGGGGHSGEILSRLSPKGRLIAFDQDRDALKNCPLKDDPRLIFVPDNFRFIRNYVLYYTHTGEISPRDKDIPGIDGIIADLGVSSHQFDTPERGFSFRFKAPLDMRMRQDEDCPTAADILATASEERLEEIFRLYGEVDSSRRLAYLICRARSESEIKTTTQFNEVCIPVLPRYAEHKALARIYQALRIEVNREMEVLGRFLDGAAASLRPGGRLAVITYHSLEDRMVKNFIKTGNIKGEQSKDIYGRTDAPLKSVNRKPIVPAESEIAANTRARSAKLRIAEKI